MRFCAKGITALTLRFLLLALVCCCCPYKTVAQTPRFYLKSLEIQPGTPPPVFSWEWRQYAVSVPNAVTSVTVTAATEDPGATLKIAGRPARNGVSSGPIAVDVGRNIIPVEVTAPDGVSRNTYTITVKRLYPTPSWVKVDKEMPWTPRDSAGELVYNGRMWLFGGYTPDLVNDVWSSRDGETWIESGAIPDPSGVNIPVNMVYDDRMWVACNNGKLYATSDGSRWELVTDSAPWAGRYAAAGTVFDGRMWVLGGRSGGTLHNDVWSSADGVAWKLETAEAPWSKRQLFSMLAVHDGKLWLLGGGLTNYHPFKSYRDVWNSPDGKNWTKVIDNAPWPGRIWSTAAVYKNRMWILGGFRAEPTWNNFGDAWYSSDGVNWREYISDPMWSPRHELSAYVFRDRLWVVAGNAWPLKNDVWYLEIPGLAFLTQPVIEEFVTARYDYQAFADFNASGEPVRYRLIEGPSWLTVDGETGQLDGTPDEAGDVTVTIEAYDSAGETARQSYTLHVLPQ